MKSQEIKMPVDYMEREDSESFIICSRKNSDHFINWLIGWGCTCGLKPRKEQNKNV